MNENEVDFYSGFEGEPEIRFIRTGVGGARYEIRMWSGYFDEIMELIEPDRGGWSGLALPYHLHEGWYAGEAWPIPDLREAIAQLDAIPIAKLEGPARSVAVQVVALLRAALLNGEQVTIRYE